MKKWPVHQLLISYSQIAVYRKNLDNPFPDWTDGHIRQGFAWRPGSVAFGTLGDVNSEIEVSIENRVSSGEDSLRAIAVPFEVGREGITIGSILSKTFDYEIPAGLYTLLFEAIPLKVEEKGKPKIRYAFRFIPSADTQAIILKHDGQLSTQLPLIMDAKAAV